MPCKVVRLPDGTTAIVRMAKERPRTCSACRKKAHNSKLCDFVIGYADGKPRTCDAVLCASCATHKEPDTDYCPKHAAAVQGRLKL